MPQPLMPQPTTLGFTDCSLFGRLNVSIHMNHIHYIATRTYIHIYISSQHLRYGPYTVLTNRISCLLTRCDLNTTRCSSNISKPEWLTRNTQLSISGFATTLAPYM